MRRAATAHSVDGEEMVFARALQPRSCTADAGDRFLYWLAATVTTPQLHAGRYGQLRTYLVVGSCFLCDVDPGAVIPLKDIVQHQVVLPILREPHFQTAAHGQEA